MGLNPALPVYVSVYASMTYDLTESFIQTTERRKTYKMYTLSKQNVVAGLDSPFVKALCQESHHIKLFDWFISAKHPPIKNIN